MVEIIRKIPQFQIGYVSIMPNHMHGIITLRGAATLADDPTTIPDIVGAYKSLVANGCLEIYKSRNEMMGKLWQRNYYERIIRNERAYSNISNYIMNNPAKWSRDTFNK